MEERLTVSVKEAAHLLGIGRSAAYEAVRSGEIPSIKIGRRILIPMRAIERMLDTASTKRRESTEGANHDERKLCV